MQHSIIDEIQRIVSLMTSDTITPASMCDYNRSKHKIISDPLNLYILIDFLTVEQQSKDLPTLILLEILKTVYEMLNTYQTCFQLEKILPSLSSLPISDPALVFELGRSVALISVLLFTAEQKFVLPIFDEQKNSATQLETEACVGFLDMINESMCSKKNESRAIRQKLIKLFVEFALRIMPNQPCEGIRILRSCLLFGNDATQSKTVNYNDFIKLFESEEIFGVLTHMTLLGPPEIANDSILIVTMLSRGCDCWNQLTHKVVFNIQQYILNILKDPAILDDTAKSIGIQNFLLVVKTNSSKYPFDEVIQFLYELTQTPLTTGSPFRLIIIYPSILTMFASFVKARRNEFSENLKGKMVNGFFQYISSILNAFENNVQETTETVFDIQNLLQIETALKRLLEFSDLNVVYTIFDSVVPQLMETADMSINNSMKLTFMFFSLNVCFQKFNLFLEDVSTFMPLFNLPFSLFSSMQKKFPLCFQQSVELKAPFLMNHYFLQALSTLVSIFFGIDNLSREKNMEKIEQHLLNASFSVLDITKSIFGYLFFVLQSGFDKRSAAVVMTMVLNNNSMCTELINEGEIPNFLMTNYMNLPCKKVYYYALTKLVLNNPLMQNTFLQNLTVHFSQLLLLQNLATPTNEKEANLEISNENDKENLNLNVNLNENMNLENRVKRFFKLIITFFNVSGETNKWYDFYVYIYSAFGEQIQQISQNPLFSKYVLNFVYRITETKGGEPVLPKNRDSFPSVSSHSFRIFRFFTVLLSNCVKNIEIKPLNGRRNFIESVFSAAFPVSDVYSNVFSVTSDSKNGKLNEKGNEDENEDESDWESLTDSLNAMNHFIESPFPNFGIMAMYQDTCLFEFFDALLNQVVKTSLLSLLSIPPFFEALIKFLALFSKDFTQIALANGNYLNFILNITKIAFLHQNENILRINCEILSDLCENITILKAPLKQSFRQHFVLALNLILVQPYIGSVNMFLYWFMCDEFEYLSGLNEQISAGIENEQEKNEIKTAFFNLIHRVKYDGNPEDRNGFALAIEEFLNITVNYSLKLDYIQSLAPYFMFK